ncbi:MAG: efflux transporter outer membrane subunit, partial [Verrucomicrobiota bacterium]
MNKGNKIIDKTALIVDATGIIGYNLAEHLVHRGWRTVGLARRPVNSIKSLIPIAADLLDAEGLELALADICPTHVFFTTWSRNATEQENIRINGRMMRNLLAVLRPKKSLEHFALVTGFKVYLGPFEIYGQVPPPPTPFRETLPRLDYPNFYYTLEDAVFEAATTDGFSWSVHRPHTVIGFAPSNVMNMGMTLGAYAAFCQETGHPFAFPGNEEQWTGLSDVTDARLLARHLEWAATDPLTKDQVLQVVNGDVFRWNWMWGRLAWWFGLKAVPFDGKVNRLAEQMGGARLLWAKIAQRHGLVEDDLGRIASFWHIYNDLVLDALEHEAADNNQDLKAAVARVTQARAQARIAKADFFPTLTVDPSYSWSRLSPNVLNPLPVAQGNDISVPLDLSYELDLWGRVRRSFEASNADAQARQAAFESTLLLLKADVAQNYFSIRTLDSERAIVRHTIELRRESVKLVNSLSRGGAASDLDVSQAETDLNTTEAALLALDHYRADLEHALAVLEGKPASEFAVKELPLAATTLLPVIPAGLPGDLLERRPDIAEAERALAAANARIGMAKGAFFPVVRLTGAAGFESMDVDTLFNWQSKAWSLGPSITLPL